MNRKDLQVLSVTRVREAQALLRSGLPSGAYYLAGYAVECALKACIAKQTRRYDFPDKRRVDASYTHSLRDLVRAAGLDQARSKTRSPSMDKAILVNRELETGMQIVRALDEAHVPVSVALFANLPDYGEWRLVLASSVWDKMKIRDAYGSLHKAMDSAGIQQELTPPLLILQMSDPFIKDLRRYFAKSRVIEGRRVGPQSFGNSFVDDGYVYRVA